MNKHEAGKLGGLAWAKVARCRSLEKYYKNPSVCKYCGSIINVRDNERPCDVKNKKFCNNSCSAKYNNACIDGKDKKIKLCINCGKECKKNINKYCSSKCQAEHKHNSYIKRWKLGIEDGMVGKLSISMHIKRYLFEKYDNKCAICGWDKINIYSNKIPLEVEHIDGNHTNNCEENLILLCPNCHSLTSTYKGLNLGNGRKSRKYLN